MLSALFSFLFNNSIIAFVWFITAVIAWRTITGHFAWEIHRTAKTQTTIKPPVENWVGAALIAIPLAVLWPIVLLFTIRNWPFARGTEKKMAIVLKGIELKELEMTNEREFAKLTEKVNGEVLDGDGS